LAGYFDAAALGVNDCFADRQAQAVATLDAGAGLVHAIEPFKQVRDVFRGDALAGVGHGKEDSVALGASREADFPLVAVEVDGVGQQVCDDLADALGVAEAFK
jgi:hypothetical protein